MNGLMMDWPLLIPSILRRAARFFPDKEIVSRWGDGTLHRMTYRDLEVRVHRLMNVLRGLGIGPGDRVATMAWNHHRHLELYFAVPSLGAILHTINFRLSREQLTYIVNHAQDRVIFADRSVAALLAALQRDLPAVEKYIVMDDRPPQAPPALPRPSIDYEELMAAASDRGRVPDSRREHGRGSVLHLGDDRRSEGGALQPPLDLPARDGRLHGRRRRDGRAGRRPSRGAHVPRQRLGDALLQRHGGSQAGLPGDRASSASRWPNCSRPSASTCAAGVPTIWTLLYQHLKEKRYDLSKLHTLLVGGSAASRAMIENYQRDFGIRVLHAWGMTETSPIGTVSRLKAAMEEWPEDKRIDVRLKQGIPVVGVETRILGDHGEDLPWDGIHVGELAVRGPWIASSYYNNSEAGAAFTADGWFRTGDMVTIDPYGYVQLSDRKKDLIKRKGEWISSVDMENAVQGIPGVLEAAVVGRPTRSATRYPWCSWSRRNDPNHPVEAQEIIDMLAGKFAKWQLPLIEDIHFVESLPKTGVGKLDKKILRKIVSEPR